MKYIRKTYCNTFQIEKNLYGKIISYGSFKDLKQAKEYRDLCVEKDFEKLPTQDIYAVINVAGLLPAYLKEYNPFAFKLKFLSRNAVFDTCEK